jgi:hypothetical protein
VTNNDLVGDVSDELFWDPKVDNVEIAVSAEAGVVKLRGTVGSFRQKREAKGAAERVFGVKKVANEFQVRTPSCPAPSTPRWNTATATPRKHRCGVPARDRIARSRFIGWLPGFHQGYETTTEAHRGCESRARSR